jgi:hypothetical protein
MRFPALCWAWHCLNSAGGCSGFRCGVDIHGGKHWLGRKIVDYLWHIRAAHHCHGAGADFAVTAVLTEKFVSKRYANSM